ncbi:MAG TPA: GNAT family N-acetyltransferase [Gaiellaceae bacterium]
MTGRLAELAEDTLVHVLPQRGVVQIDRGDLVFTSTGNTATVQRVRLGDVEEAVAWVRKRAHEHEVLGLDWWVGWHATPSNLGERLLALGLVPDPDEPTLTGMTCEEPPPAAPEIEVRRIETLEEQLDVLEVDWDVWSHTDTERERRAETERRRFDPNGNVQHFGAYVDGRPVGFGRAVDMDHGVALLGGAVLADHRGKGVYRALVRARWEHAVARGTPILVVQAGRMSEPVLRNLGFQAHGVLHLYADPGVSSGHGDDGDKHRAR